ncbi:LysM peptidoglycan-binding domain-containing protein [Streptococcus merionis]|uniref:LysM domain-containing protein n=1 Tax=Streptococcus merionis TaxID=400065 RepID=A0A239SYC8_9STRE|nr:LysM peptidoglycan-binding domain-containing protein [Streptococcus merionis]SNU90336.1 LysM domain-containing protein [Streptococcus merionis]
MHFLKDFSLKTALIGLAAFAALFTTSSAQADEKDNTSKKEDEKTYTVKAGDTLSQIAKDHNRELDYLIALNEIKNSDHIDVGQEIKLGDGEKLSEGKTLPRVKAVYTVQASSTSATTVSSFVSTATPTYYTPASASGGVVLSNGNTTGATGAYAAQQMAAATGVPASTWEHIIARESNGQVDAYNSSGASGLFQTMPGWGSTATVEDQIQSALNAYNAQGLSAWGY